MINALLDMMFMVVFCSTVLSILILLGFFLWWTIKFLRILFMED